MKKIIVTLLIVLAIVACSKEEIKKLEGKVDVTLLKGCQWQCTKKLGSLRLQPVGLGE